MSWLSEFTETAVTNLQAFACDEGVLESVVETIDGQDGTVYAIGIGKSSFIARKFAASLQSIGVRASFLHPAEALHGDCGSVQSGDLCVIISKSGNSHEITSLLPVLCDRSTRVIAITNSDASPLAKVADIVMPLRVREEGDQDNLLPLVSCQASLFLCDCLVMRLASKRSLTTERFRQNHPNGQIGLNLNRTLKDLRQWQARRPFVAPDTALVEALIIISDHRVGMCCVLDVDSKFVGIITDGDIRRALMSGLDLRETLAREVMNKEPKTAKEDTPLSEVFNMMECGEQKLAAIPILNDFQECGGIVQIHDLMVGVREATLAKAAAG